ncbi:hypothetical protein F5B18DRAFT_40785 [Nemania serpens]|nr:hypothetical protein F5B18DRAFT_40785 [Nemania serpens]
MGGRASFLGVPPEIRHNIYGHVICIDLDHKVITLYKDGWARTGGFSTIMHHRPEALFLPWVNLLLACRQVNAELSAYMNSGSVLENEDNRTYSMDIIGLSRGVLQAATWRRIPCHPSKVDTFSVQLRIENKKSQATRLRIWGNGGPLPVVRQLYQTLNLVLHNGPVLCRASPLSHPLKLKRMVMRVTAAKASGAEDSANVTPTSMTQSDSSSSDFESSVGGLINHLEHIGLLWGYIDHVQLIDRKGQQEFAIEQVKDAGVPADWDKYGFEWGSDASACVSWETTEE